MESLHINPNKIAVCYNNTCNIQSKSITVNWGPLLCHFFAIRSYSCIIHNHDKLWLLFVSTHIWICLNSKKQYIKGHFTKVQSTKRREKKRKAKKENKKHAQKKLPTYSKLLEISTKLWALKIVLNRIKPDPIIMAPKQMNILHILYSI